MICPALQNLETKLPEVFPTVAAHRLRNKELFNLTHSEIILYDVKSKKNLNEKELFEKIYAKSQELGNKLIVIKGNTGTGKSEFCVGLHFYLESLRINPLYFYKEMTFKNIYEKLMKFYTSKTGKTFEQGEQIDKLLENLVDPINDKEKLKKRDNFIDLIYATVFFEKKERPNDIEAKEIKEALVRGITRFYDPKQRGDIKQFFNDKEYNSSLGLKKYFTSQQEANKSFYNAMMLKTPKITDFLESLLKTLKNERLYVIFEDFSFDESEANDLIKIMLSDDAEFKSTFIIAGTPNNIDNIIKSQDTLLDRALIFQTDNYNNQNNKYEVFTFSMIKPVDFLKPYIAFFKTYNNVLKIQNGEKIQFLDNQNSEICNKCKNKFYCSNLENKILFPFNIEIIKKIFNGIPLIKKNPRIMLDNIRLILQKYLSGTNPYDSLNSMDITLNESVSIDNFNGFSQDEINFLKWYGLDYQLFELFFEKPFPKHQNPIVKKISEKSKENKITIILDEELSKLVNNIHKFTTNCFNFKDQEVEKIYKLCNKYFLQKCHFLFYNPYLKLNNLRLKYASTPIFYFKDKFDKKGEIQFQIDIENWNELIIAHIIKYQYFIDSNNKDYCNSEESIKYEDIINSIFGIYIRNFLYQINYNIDREFPGCFEKIVIYSLYQIYILIFDYFSKDYPTFQQFIFNYKGKVIIKKDLINYFVDKDIPDFKEKLEITNYTEYLIKIVNFYFDRNPNVLIDNIEKNSEYFFKVAKKEFKKKGFYYIIGNNNNIFDIKEIWDSICNFKILLNKVDNYIYNKCNLGNMEFQQDYTSNTEMLSFYIQNYENISKIITGIQKDIKLMKKSHYSIKLVDLIETIHEIWNEKNIFDKDKINEILKNLSMINSSNENKRESFIKYMNFKSTDVYNVLYRFYNDFIISSIPLNPLINESNIELLNKILLKIENIPGFNKLGIIVPQNKIDEQINESKNKIDILNNNLNIFKNNWLNNDLNLKISMYLNFIIKNYYYIRLLILFEQKYQSFSLNYNENLHDLYQNVIYLSNYNLIDIEVQSSLGNIINNNYNQIYQIYSNFLQDLSIELNKMESLNMFLNEIPQNQIKDLNQKIKNLQMFEKDIDPTKFEEIELDLEKKSIDFYELYRNSLKLISDSYSNEINLLNDKKAENIMENLFKNIPISIADIEPNTLLNIQKLKFKNNIVLKIDKSKNK